MLATLIIVFREIMEAGLVIGIVLAATHGVRGRSRFVSLGIAGGTLGACIVALFARSISNALAGFGQEFFNVGVLSLAVFMLTWHNVWMSRHGRDIAMHMKTLGEEVTAGRRSLLALAVVVGIACLREGSEIVLFLYGIVISSSDSTPAMIAGGIVGLLAGAALTVVTYLGLMHIPNRHLFKVTGILLALLAAGMAAQAVAFLEQAQVITFMTATLWNTSWLISNDSWLGKALHTLIGYNARPSQIQMLVYFVTLCIIFILMRLMGHAPKLSTDNKNT